jgi:ribonuclease P protein component
VQRLKTRPQFQAVLAGSVVARTEHFVLHRNSLLPLEAPALQATPETAQDKKPGQGFTARPLFPVPDVWIGAMVPKRWAKRAVTRNAIKRQIYTVSVDLLHNYPQAAFLVRLRREFSRKEFVSATSVQLNEAVRAEVTALMRAGPGTM